jgi:hypothetical protein
MQDGTRQSWIQRSGKNQAMCCILIQLIAAVQAKAATYVGRPARHRFGAGLGLVGLANGRALWYRRPTPAPLVSLFAYVFSLCVVRWAGVAPEA